MTITPSSTIGFALRGDTLGRWTEFNPVLRTGRLSLRQTRTSSKSATG